MIVNNEIISKPDVAITTEIGKILHASACSGMNICLHPNINKWSKVKPIDYPKLRSLIPDEFLGNKTGQGIRYGMRVSMDAGRWDTLHNADYEYVDKPKGGEGSPYRMSDFDGYWHDAKPDLRGVIPSICYYNANLEVQVIYNQYSSDKAVSINDLAPSNIAGRALGFYPCVLIDHYVHALRNSNGDYTRLMEDDVIYQNFYIEIPSNLQSDTNRTVTVFLAQQIQNGLGFDIKTKWVDTSGTLSNTPSVLVIPDAGGKTVEFAYYVDEYIVVDIQQRDDNYLLYFDGSSGFDISDQGLTGKVKVTCKGVEKTFDIIAVPIYAPSPVIGGLPTIVGSRHYATFSASNFGLPSISGPATIALNSRNTGLWVSKAITLP